MLAGLLVIPALATAGELGPCASPPPVAAPEGSLEVFLEICGGDGQATPVGTPFPQPLTVRLDTRPAPTDGASVTALPDVDIFFEVIPAANGAGATPAEATVRTDAQGIATLALTANTVPGEFRVSAQAQGKGMSTAVAEFTLRNTGQVPQPTAHPVPTLALPGLLALALGVLLLAARLR